MFHELINKFTLTDIIYIDHKTRKNILNKKLSLNISTVYSNCRLQAEIIY